MKYLLWFLVGGLAWWWWRRHHLASTAKSEPPDPAPGEPVPMVHCASCGVHLPLTDASRDTDGHYHCAEHRPPKA